MPRKKSHPAIGSNFEDFPAEEGRLEQATALGRSVRVALAA